MTFVLVSTFNSQGKLLSSTEEGPLLNNPTRTYDLYSPVWTESGTGLANPLNLPRLPLYFFSKTLYEFGLKPIWIQALAMAVLLLIPFISLPILVERLKFGSVGVGYIAGIFYVFNLYTQTQVAHRFLISQIFLWSLLPLLMIATDMILERISIKRIILLLVASLLILPAYSLVSSLIVIFCALSFIVIPRFVSNIGIFFRVILVLIVWILVNFYWLYPLYGVRTDNNYSSSVNSNQNIISLIDVSKFYDKASVPLLIQKYYFSVNNNWNKYTLNNFIPTAVLIITLCGIFLSRRKASWAILFTMFTMGWFVSKGANPPFGKLFFENLFTYVPVAQSLRNPYEKFGIIFLIPYSIFFAYGLDWIKTKNRIVASVVILLISIILTRPLITGNVFSGMAVDIPDDYKKANIFLSSSDSRTLLRLPFLHGAEVKYNWGYSSVDQSELFFNRPVLSRTFNRPEEIYPKLYKHLKDTNFPVFFQMLAIDTVVIQKEISQSKYFQEDYSSSAAIVNKWEGVTRMMDLPEMSIYKYTKSPIFLGYVPNMVQRVNSFDEGVEWVSQQKNYSGNSFILENIEVDMPKDLAQPKVMVKRINPSRYQINISESTGPFVFILSNTYNKNWIARLDGLQLKHFKINGFSNGWIVDKQGSYNIDIIFKIWPWE